MKHFILILLVSYISSTLVLAQTEDTISINLKGNFILGGDFSVNYTKNNRADLDIKPSITLSIAPTFGYMINKNIAIGSQFNFMLINRNDVGLSIPGNSPVVLKSNEKIYTISPFLRYHKRLKNNFFLYVEPSFFYSIHYTPKRSIIYINPNLYYDPNSGPMITYGMRTNLGMIYFLKNNINLEISFLDLNFIQNKDSRQISLTHLFNNPTLGVKYYFKTK